MKHECIYDHLLKENKNHRKKLQLQEIPKQLFKSKLLLNSKITTNNNNNSSGEKLTLENTKPISIFLYSDSLLAKNDAEYTCGMSGQYINGGQYRCKEEDILTSDKRYYLVNTILSRTIEILRSTLQVPQRQGGNITVDGNACSSSTAGPIQYPPHLTSPGVDADLILFLTARPIISNGTVLAFGFDCTLDQSLRTIVGQLNFNPSSISMAPKDYRFQMGVAIHELSHVLGFSKDRFEKKGLMKSFDKRNTTADGSSKLSNMIVSPNVVSFVRKFFDCPSLEGAELEDQGGTGTEFSHWEKRIFDNEYMTGTASQYPIFSNLTLSLFADLGFYAVNFTNAETLVWGNGLGCTFASKPCNEWGNSKLFCTSIGSRALCSYDRISKGQCSITRQPDIPDYYNYLNGLNGNYGNRVGGDVLPDYCPSIEGYSNMFCVDSSHNSYFNTNSTSADPNPNAYGELYGASSRCFDSSLIDSQDITYLQTEARCYPTHCLSPYKLKIKVGQYFYNCPYGGSITIPNYLGSITCPASKEVCIDAPLDNTWPTFEYTYKPSGSPGDTITIFGRNFLNNINNKNNNKNSNNNSNNSNNNNSSSSSSSNNEIINNSTIKVLIQNIEMINLYVTDTMIIGTINPIGYENPQKTDGIEVNMIIVNTETKRNDNTFGFVLFVPYEKDPTTVSKVKQWFKDHWYVALLVGLAVLGFIGGIVRCICCSSRKPKGNQNQSKMKRYPQQPYE
ncbi:hypothetical protein ACTFIR_011466 [Dictyostelium discoideum]